jgi:hypothetical protein
MKYELSPKGYFDFISQNKANATILFSIGAISGILLLKLLKK